MGQGEVLWGMGSGTFMMGTEKFICFGSSEAREVCLRECLDWKGCGGGVRGDGVGPLVREDWLLAVRSGGGHFS